MVHSTAEHCTRIHSDTCTEEGKRNTKLEHKSVSRRSKCRHEKAFMVELKNENEALDARFSRAFAACA